MTARVVLYTAVDVLFTEIRMRRRIKGGRLKRKEDVWERRKEKKKKEQIPSSWLMGEGILLTTYYSVWCGWWVATQATLSFGGCHSGSSVWCGWLVATQATLSFFGGCHSGSWFTFHHFFFSAGMTGVEAGVAHSAGMAGCCKAAMDSVMPQRHGVSSCSALLAFEPRRFALCCLLARRLWKLVSKTVRITKHELRICYEKWQSLEL